LHSDSKEREKTVKESVKSVLDKEGLDMELGVDGKIRQCGCYLSLLHGISPLTPLRDWSAEEPAGCAEAPGWSGGKMHRK
jgi:hypothetical protein